ncbi:cyd operon YbgE family protein [Pseudoalteromonas xiamenensis]|uniref:cyd operon YbgE family protein n=1 Tax=Pseudoalteromonas xiamenensis TaxID=882626 RepID=UPI0035EDC715
MTYSLNSRCSIYASRFAALQQNVMLQYVSFLLATITTVLVLFWPPVAINTQGQVDHGTFTLVMLANSAAFIHGIGFKPHTLLWRCLFTPFFAWPPLIWFLLGLA